MVNVLWWLLFASATALKTWLPNTNMDDANNWKNVEVPKNCDRVLLPVDDGLFLVWPEKDFTVTGLALPESGSLIFDSSVRIRFDDGSKCPKSREVEFARNDWKKWLDPSNWMTNSTDLWLPHSERIPCFGEDIVFPPGRGFAVDLPTVLVPIGKIFFGGEEYDGDEWGEFLDSDDRGKTMFRSEYDAMLPWFHDVPCYGNRKCACGKSAYVFKNRGYEDVPVSKLHDVVCSEARHLCEAPECYSPVVPEGHCCPICEQKPLGAMVKIRDDSADDELLNRIRNTINDIMMTSGYERMKFYIGRTIDENIQVVILAGESDYESDALTFAASVKDMIVESYSGKIISINFSRLTLSNYFLNAGSGIVFGTLVAVVLFFILIYYIFIVFKPKNNLLQLPKENPFRFARFRNVIQEANSEEKLEIGTGQEAFGENSQGFQNLTFSASSECKNVCSKPQMEHLPEPECASQEYSNPTYHEMEKTRELTLFEVEPEASENLNMDELEEVAF